MPHCGKYPTTIGGSGAGSSCAIASEAVKHKPIVSKTLSMTGRAWLAGPLLNSISWTSNWIDARKTLLDGGKHRKCRMRLVLIPIRDRKEIIGAMVGGAMFDRRSESLGERNRRIQMKSIYGRTAARRLRALHRRSEKSVRKRMIAKIPRPKEVIF